MDHKLEMLCIIKDEMLMDPLVEASLVIKAYKLAETDNYLYELLIDWMKVVDTNIKNLLRDDVLNYVQEINRKQRIRDDA